jgi:hypothetical protein
MFDEMDGEDNMAYATIVVCCKLVGHGQCQWIQGGCKPIGGLGCGCARCVGHNACHTKLVQNSYQFILGEFEELAIVMILNITNHSWSIDAIFFPITYIRILVNGLKSISIISPKCTKTTHFYNIMCQVSRHELGLMQMDHGDVVNI